MSDELKPPCRCAECGETTFAYVADTIGVFRCVGCKKLHAGIRPTVPSEVSEPIVSDQDKAILDNHFELAGLLGDYETPKAYERLVKAYKAALSTVPSEVSEAIKRIMAVPMYSSDCCCEPPGHDRDCSGVNRVADSHEFASKDDERCVAAFLRHFHLSSSPVSERAQEWDNGRPGGLSSDGSSQQAVSPVPAPIPDVDFDEIYPRKCVGAHDRCFGGAGGECPYCERDWVGSPAAIEIANRAVEMHEAQSIAAVAIWSGALIGAELGIRLTAKAIEARRAETGTGSVHESAVGEANSPESSQRPNNPTTPEDSNHG